MSDAYLSVVIPAYNEETNIRLGALDKVSRYLERQRYEWEAIIVDDGSTDASVSLLDQFASENKRFSVVHNTHQGKAATVITGMLAAKGSYVLFTDLDQATPIYEVEKLLPWLTKGYQIAIGSRHAQRAGAPLTRRIMARGFMILRSVLLGLRGVSDTQCGFKAFERKTAQNIFQKLLLYGTRRAVSGSMVSAGFDIEVLYVARQLGYRIKEVPVEWHYVETRRVNPFKDSLHGLLDIIRIRINAWKGCYR